MSAPERLDQQLGTPTFEAIVIRRKPGDFGAMDETLDPVLSLTIDNGLHHYTFAPDEVLSITIRPLQVAE